MFLEAPPRFELGNKGFADLCLTTWLWRPERVEGYRFAAGVSRVGGAVHRLPSAMSSYQAVADSPVLSVSVMIATAPALPGGSPKIFT
jgi:hypothetical protein